MIEQHFNYFDEAQFIHIIYTHFLFLLYWNFGAIHIYFTNMVSNTWSTIACDKQVWWCLIIKEKWFFVYVRVCVWMSFCHIMWNILLERWLKFIFSWWIPESVAVNGRTMLRVFLMHTTNSDLCERSVCILSIIFTGWINETTDILASAYSFVHTKIYIDRPS